MTFISVDQRKRLGLEFKPSFEVGAPHANSTSPYATGPGTVDMAKDIPQAVARTVGTVGISAGNLPYRAVGKEGPFQDEIDTTGSPVTRAIFGDTPIKSFRKYGEAGIEFVDDTTGLAIDRRFAPFYAVAGIALDLSGTGKGAKTVFKSLHNAKTLEEAAGVMRTAGFDDDIIKDYAPIFAKTTAKEETSKALEAALKLQESTIKVSGYRPKTGETPLSSGKIPVKKYVAPPEVRIKSGDVPVQYVEGGGFVPIKDARYTKSGDIFVKGIRHEAVREVPIIDKRTRTIKGVESEKPYQVSMTKEGGTYPKTGDIFVGGIKYEVAKEIPITDARYQTKGDIPVRESFEEAKPFVDDLPANPATENFGLLATKVQERYGEASVTLKNAAKVKQAEEQVFNQLDGYAQESAERIKADGSLSDMVQKVPEWISDALRDPVLFRVVVDMVQRGDVPHVVGSPEYRLYNEMVNEIARKSGAVKKGQIIPVDGPGVVVQAQVERTRPIGSTLAPSDAPLPKAKEVDNGVDYGKEYKNLKDMDADFKTHYDSHGLAHMPKERKSLESMNVKFEELKDITPQKGKWMDVYITSEKVFGDMWAKVKEVVFDPIDRAKGRFAADEAMMKDRLKVEIIDKYGIKKGSKESKYLMDYGEGLINAQKLIDTFGAEKAKGIVEADVWFRAEYNRMIRELNAVTVRLFPGQPNKLIAYRQDYYRHFEEMSDGWTGLKNAFEDPALTNLSSSEIGKGKIRRFLSIAQERLGFGTKRDAVGGMLNYIPQWAFAKNMDMQTARLRQFIKFLAENTEKTKNVENYIDQLRMTADSLAGEVNYMDRYFEGTWLGKRGVAVLDFANKRAKRNAILLNFSTSISQAFNLPQIVGNAGPIHSVVGMKNAMKDMASQFGGSHVPIWKDDSFMMERYRHEKDYQFSNGAMERTKDFASWLITTLDKTVATISYNSHYQKAVKEGISNPKMYASNMTRKMVGGRGIMEVPLIQQSKVFQMIAPFQYEVLNSIFRQMEFAQKKNFKALATMYVVGYLMNKGAEQIKGQDVIFDPIQALYDAGDEALSEDDVKTKAIKIPGRLAGEVLSSVPMGNYMVAGIAASYGMDDKARKEFFGEDNDPVRFGSAPLLWNATNVRESWRNPVFGILPAWGGLQIGKTLGAIDALAKGEVVDADGEVVMPIKPGVTGALQNILFGKWQPNFQYQKEVEKEMTALYKENEVLVNSGVDTDKELALKNLKELTPEIKKVYAEVVKVERAKEVQRYKNQTQPLVRTLDALVREGKIDEAKKVLAGLSDKDKRFVAAIRQENAQEVTDMNKEDAVSPETAIREAWDYAYAFGTNPIQAYNIVFRNHEHIRDTVGGSFTGMVRTRRISQAESDQIKKDLGDNLNDDNKLYLDHKLPVSLNGSNLLTNLELVSEEQWKSTTAMETYLINAVKTQKIDYQEAAVLILRYKGYEGEPITAEEIKKIVGVDSFPKGLGDMEHRGVDDWFRNSWPLADEDNTERNDHRRRFVDVIK